MSKDRPQVVPYKRGQFSTRLPVNYHYSPSHWWAVEVGDGLWHAGITKFSTRMLGDMVDHGFEVKPKSPIRAGSIIGWLEGFKAISDIYCIANGTFEAENPSLGKDITVINRDPYVDGWIFSFTGQIDSKCVKLDEYVEILNKTIDKILEQQKSEDIQ